MIILILCFAGLIIVGAGLIIWQQLCRQDKRIDTLLAYIDPKAYRSKNVSDKTSTPEYQGPKKEVTDFTAQHMSTP
jgi:hypothetical protein